MTILYLVGDFTGMDAGWEFDFQELVTLMPRNLQERDCVSCIKFKQIKTSKIVPSCLLLAMKAQHQLNPDSLIKFVTLSDL